MGFIKRRFSLHIRNGGLPYAYAYKKTLHTLFRVGAIAVACYDLAQREASLDQALLFITAAVACLLLTVKTHSEYTELKHRFFRHVFTRRSRR